MLFILLSFPQNFIPVLNLLQDPDCSECYCGWCGKNNDLVSCRSCRTLFCTACIKRNIGEEYLYKVPVSGWQCCCCSPSLLQRLTSQLEKAMGSGDIMVSSSDSDSDSSDTNDGVTIRYSVHYETDLWL
jgi:transcriptional regulator ATRX